MSQPNPLIPPPVPAPHLLPSSTFTPAPAASFPNPNPSQIVNPNVNPNVGQAHPPPPINHVEFKVLRLSAPVFDRRPVTIDDPPTDSVINASAPEDVISKFFTLTPRLSLPASFGDVRVGETFRALMVLVRTPTSSPTLALRSVCIHVQVSVQSDALSSTIGQGTSMANASANAGMMSSASGMGMGKRTVVETLPMDNMPPRSHLDTVINHRVMAPGQHIIQATATFSIDPAGNASQTQIQAAQSITFRRFFKFMAVLPFAVRCVSFIASRTVVAVDIECLSDAPLCLVAVQGIPIASGNNSGGSGGSALLDDGVYMKKGDVYRCVRSVSVPASTMDVHVAWRSSFGASGEWLFERNAVALVHPSASPFQSSFFSTPNSGSVMSGSVSGVVRNPPSPAVLARRSSVPHLDFTDTMLLLATQPAINTVSSSQSLLNLASVSAAPPTTAIFVSNPSSTGSSGSMISNSSGHSSAASGMAMPMMMANDKSTKMTVRIEVLKIEPATVVSESAFRVTFQITRLSTGEKEKEKETGDLLFYGAYHGNTNFPVDGPLSVPLGPFDASGRIQFSVRFFAESPGLHPLGPIYLVNTASGQQFAFHALQHILVVPCFSLDATPATASYGQEETVSAAVTIDPF
eukprot:ANDGO_03380.mRNA.1 hypothetical protein